MKMLIKILATVSFAAFVSCSDGGASAFCDAVEALGTFDKKTATTEDLKKLIDDMVEAAPGEIEDSAKSFGESIEATLTGDFEKAADPENARAGAAIGEYTEKNCKSD